MKREPNFSIDVVGATIRTPGGRLLFDGLELRLGREHVALIGRNGVGKSTLLATLAGRADLAKGRVTASSVHYVPQVLDREPIGRAPLSSGQKRRRALEEAKASGADALLLDEPTEDLDDEGVSWLRGWLARYDGSVIVASHDRRLLEDFRDFLIVSEAGCRHFEGALRGLEAELGRIHDAEEERYARSLNRLIAYEEHTLHIDRRRARKKRRGRCSELDRATPRILLNTKRSQAQVYHGKGSVMRKARLEAIRKVSKAARRTLAVNLAFDLPVPQLPFVADDVLVLRNAAVRAADDGRLLVNGIDLALGRKRVAVVGPNGAGKTTLLDVMLGRCAPASGIASRDLSRIGFIAQGGSNWMLDDSLLGCLTFERSESNPEEIAKLLALHRFPLALAERPLHSLSPGERTRAALLCLFQRTPAVEVLVLDEPTYSLDLIGRGAMTEALRAWPGGLVVAGHDRPFLDEIGIDTTVALASESQDDRPRYADRDGATGRDSHQR